MLPRYADQLHVEEVRYADQHHVADARYADQRHVVEVGGYAGTQLDAVLQGGRWV